MIDKATRKFIAICRDEGNDKVKKAAVDYAREVETYISGLEMDLMHTHRRIMDLYADIQLHVAVMRSYGIDTDQLARRSIYTILGDIELAGMTYRQPENIQITTND
jgi:hypothetical protein